MRHNSSQAIPLFPFFMGSSDARIWWETYLTSGRRGVEGFAAATGAFASDPAFALVDMLNGLAGHYFSQIRIFKGRNGPSPKNRPNAKF